MSNEYIRRQDVVEAVHEEFDGCTVWDESGKRTADEVESIIDRVLSADVVPVVHGRWKKQYRYQVNSICSVCGNEVGRCTRYCPNCGAKMDREE